jgi:hypothetical protein
MASSALGVPGLAALRLYSRVLLENASCQQLTNAPLWRRCESQIWSSGVPRNGSTLPCLSCGSITHVRRLGLVKWI